MNVTNTTTTEPTMGDIGEEQEEVEAEPIEIPQPAREPETVPA